MRGAWGMYGVAWRVAREWRRACACARARVGGRWAGCSEVLVRERLGRALEALEEL